MFRRLIFIFLVITGLSCKPNLPDPIAQAMEELPEQVDFNIHVKPILSDNCFSCHGPDEAAREAGMRLDLPDAAYAATEESGKIPLTPGKLNQSEVFHRIISEDPDYLMPTPESHLTLTNRQKAILIKWIQSGAKYQPHWAFITPKLPALPAPKIKDWSNQPIDLFIGQNSWNMDLNLVHLLPKNCSLED